MTIPFTSAYSAINQYSAMVHLLDDGQTVVIPRQNNTPADVLELLERQGREFLAKRAHARD